MYDPVAPSGTKANCTQATTSLPNINGDGRVVLSLQLHNSCLWEDRKQAGCLVVSFTG